MASQLPAKLKAADIGRFATRAAQLQTARPAIAYWCEYWIVNQLLAKGLHSADEECLQYTTNLMDKLEQTKTDNADNEAIISDAAGQIYVEQFGLETFERAERAVQADKVTKQTADTFLAAATFLDLINIWSTPDVDIQAKIKYAKFHAVRILKAYKEGKDPNESNPHPELDLVEKELAPLDPNDPEVQALGGVQSGPYQPTVEEVPDDQDAIQSHLAAQSTHNYSLHPSQQPSQQPSAQHSPGISSVGHGDTNGADDKDVSPMENEESPNPRSGSIGGGYFPDVPSDTQDIVFPSAPSHSTRPDSSNSSVADDVEAPTDDIPTIPSVSTPPMEFPSAPQDFYMNDKPSAPSPTTLLPPPTPEPAPITPIIPKAQPTQPTVQPVFGSNPNLPEVYTTDDLAIAKAQKHCKWAISALNFDDAATAVKELRAALATLGARV